MKTSNAGTKYMLSLAVAHLEHLKATLVKVQNATELTVSYDFGPGRYERKRYVHDQKTVVVAKGAQYKDEYHEELQDGVRVGTDESGKSWNSRVFVFEKVQSDRIYDLNRDIKGMEGEVTFLNTKIVEWKP